MVNYRRNKHKGGCYFFTVNLADRQQNYLVRYYDSLQRSFLRVKQKYPFKQLTYVVLPDHLHAIWQLPDNDEDYAKRWRLIKRNFTESLLDLDVPLKKRSGAGFELWQRRYWEHTISDAADLENHMHYVHYNPVKHGYVSQVKDWQYSSFHHYVSRGIYNEQWGVVEPSSKSISYGEAF